MRTHYWLYAQRRIVSRNVWKVDFQLDYFGLKWTHIIYVQWRVQPKSRPLRPLPWIL